MIESTPYFLEQPLQCTLVLSVNCKHRMMRLGRKRRNYVEENAELRTTNLRRLATSCGSLVNRGECRMAGVGWDRDPQRHDARCTVSKP